MNEITKCDLKPEDIIRLALEHFGAILKPSDLEVKLAALAVASEREACAKVCEDEQFELAKYIAGRNVLQHFNSGCRSCAAAIRARG